MLSKVIVLQPANACILLGMVTSGHVYKDGGHTAVEILMALSFIELESGAMGD